MKSKGTASAERMALMADYIDSMIKLRPMHQKEAFYCCSW